MVGAIRNQNSVFVEEDSKQFVSFTDCRFGEIQGVNARLRTKRTTLNEQTDGFSGHSYIFLTTCSELAEGRGFEPREVVNLAGFQNQCFRPLSHPSDVVALGNWNFSESILRELYTIVPKTVAI